MRERVHEREREHEPDEEEREEGFTGPWYAFPPMRNALAAGVLLFAGWLLRRTTINPYIPIAVFVVAILIGAYFWVREGIEEFRDEREVGIEALMFFATLGAIILGEWFEAAFLVFLFAAAEAIEGYTFARTRNAIRALLDLAPETATRIRDGREERVPAENGLQPTFSQTPPRSPRSMTAAFKPSWPARIAATYPP